MIFIIFFFGWPIEKSCHGILERAGKKNGLGREKQNGFAAGPKINSAASQIIPNQDRLVFRRVFRNIAADKKPACRVIIFQKLKTLYLSFILSGLAA